MSDGISTECPGCGHTWEYSGDKDRGETTTCGRCQRGFVTIGNVACPGCGEPGGGDRVLAHNQRWCITEACRVVSFKEVEV